MNPRVSHRVGATRGPDAGPKLARVLSAPDIGVVAVSYVMASTTLVSDLTGWLTQGAGFLWPLLAAAVINLLLALSVAELSDSFPRCGAVYSFASEVFRPLRGHRPLGAFLAVTFIGMTVLAGAGEVSNGAFSLRALFGWQIDARWFVAALLVGALLSNLFGPRVTTRLALAALVAMIGLRWTFGALAFVGLSRTGAWSSNAIADTAFAEPGVTTLSGLGFAFWTLVGVEVVAPFAEETRGGRMVLLRGMVGALAVVLASSVVMGLGIAGAIPRHDWGRLLASEAACGGDCPHLAVGRAMLGRPGATWMALSAAFACYSTVVIGLFSIARIIHALARDEGFFGGMSPMFGRATADGRPPRATLVAAALLVGLPPLFAQQVIPWLLPAAFIWILLYGVLHLLVLVDRWRFPGRARPLGLPASVPVLGLLATAAAIPVVFRAVDVVGLAGRAAWVLAVAAITTALALSVRGLRRGTG